jgi:hypothetical protein
MAMHSSSDVHHRHVWHNLFSLHELNTGRTKDEVMPENETKQGQQGQLR